MALGAKPNSPGPTEYLLLHQSLMKNSVAQTDNLLAQLDIGNVSAMGTADLVSQLLIVRMTAVLSKQFSQRVGGAGIAGLLNTALANNHGELVIPAIFTGTFQHPKFTPDLQKVAQMKLLSPHRTKSSLRIQPTRASVIFQTCDRHRLQIRTIKPLWLIREELSGETVKHPEKRDKPRRQGYVSKCLRQAQKERQLDGLREPCCAYGVHSQRKHQTPIERIVLEREMFVAVSPDPQDN